MDPCENQDQNHHHHQQQQQQQQLQLLQQREWLSCSTSSRPGQMDPELQEVTIEDENGCENVEKGGGYGVVVVEREHMFDKVVTPSDVGKLNRLVIPKQHAEKYFPLDSTNNNSSSGNNNNEINNNNNKAGLLLNFEDRTGKSWRFRYSYWNSSQSYVMTKGWSRFVKEKQLSAGDIVSFQRAVGDDVLSKNTFFIDWRRRPPDHHQYHHHHHHHLGTAFSVHHSLPGWRISNSNSSSSNSSSIIPSPSTSPTFFLRSHPHESHPHHHHNNNNNSNNNYALWDHSSSYNNVTHLSMVPYAYGGSGTTSVVNPSGSLILLRSPVPNPSAINHPQLVPNYPRYLSGSSSTTPASSTTFQGGTRLFEPKVYDSVPVVHGKTPAPQPDGGGAAKRSLRLFGVNMEYDHHHLQLNGSMGTSTTLSPPSTSNFKAQQN